MIFMNNTMKNAPKDYKPPFSDRARTSLIDDCKREVERQRIPVSQTWLRQ